MDLLIGECGMRIFKAMLTGLGEGIVVVLCLRIGMMRGMAGNSYAKQSAPGEAPGFEAHLRAAAGKAVPASDWRETECNGGRLEGLWLIFVKCVVEAIGEEGERVRCRFAEAKSEWRVKDEQGWLEAARRRDVRLPKMLLVLVILEED